MIFKIPARSPDLNPIQNFFNIVAKDLKKQAVDNNIRKKNEQFSERIKQTMLAYQMEKINKIIETVDKRVTMVLAVKGIRIRYQEKKKVVLFVSPKQFFSEYFVWVFIVTIFFDENLLFRNVICIQVWFYCYSEAYLGLPQYLRWSLL